MSLLLKDAAFFPFWNVKCFLRGIMLTPQFHGMNDIVWQKEGEKKGTEFGVQQPGFYCLVLHGVEQVTEACFTLGWSCLALPPSQRCDGRCCGNSWRAIQTSAVVTNQNKTGLPDNRDISSFQKGDTVTLSGLMTCWPSFQVVHEFSFSRWCANSMGWEERKAPKKKIRFYTE